VDVEVGVTITVGVPVGMMVGVMVGLGVLDLLGAGLVLGALLVGEGDFRAGFGFLEAAALGGATTGWF
jgi:hypothetical protein